MPPRFNEFTDDDFGEIIAAAQKAQKAVLAVGNFAITVILLQKFAGIAARYIDEELLALQNVKR